MTPCHLPCPSCELQEDYLECKRQRLEGLLAAAGLMLKTLAVEHGLLSPGGVRRAHAAQLAAPACRPRLAACAVACLLEDSMTHISKTCPVHAVAAAA